MSKHVELLFKVNIEQLMKHRLPEEALKKLEIVENSITCIIQDFEEFMDEYIYDYSKGVRSLQDFGKGGRWKVLDCALAMLYGAKEKIRYIRQLDEVMKMDNE